MILQQYIKNNDLRKIDHIDRFQGSPIIQKETIASHSWWVTFFVRILPPKIFNESAFEKNSQLSLFNYSEMLLNLLSHSLFHDLGEITVGDILFTVKYNSFNGGKLRQALSEYEEHRMSQLFSKDDLIVKYSKTTGIMYQKHILKICDFLALLKQLQNEHLFGNRNLDEILKNTKAALIKNANLLKTELNAVFPKEYINQKFNHSFINEVKDFKL